MLYVKTALVQPSLNAGAISITTQKAPVGVLMDEAKQSFCVIAGGKEFIRDSILSAMLAKNQIFPSLNILVVPVEMGVAGDGKGPKGLAKGFGDSSMSYEEQGYVAAPVNVSVLCPIVKFCGRALSGHGVTFWRLRHADHGKHPMLDLLQRPLPSHLPSSTAVRPPGWVIFVCDPIEQFVNSIFF